MSTSSETATRTVGMARFASSLAFEDIPSEVVEHAKLAILDQLGCALFGSTLPWSEMLTDIALDEGGDGPAVIWGTARTTSPGQAALANGAAGHGFEIDDLHMTGLFHPGAVTMPATLAVAEWKGAASGRDLLTAFVAGVEVGARSGQALGQPHFLAGYHPQGTVGTFAATAAAGRMLGLDAHQMEHALGIGASHAAGLMGAQEGAMVKRFHSGRAAQSGVLSARLAQRGYTGTEAVFDVEFGGVLSTLGGATVKPEALTSGLGERWETLAIEFKAHAACAAIHTALDGAGQIREEGNLGPDDVERVLARTTTHTLLHCGWPYRPSGMTAAQMNLQFGLAAVFVEGGAGVRQYTEEKIADPALVDFSQRVDVVASPEFDALGPDRRHTTTLQVTTRDGRRFERTISNRRGSLSHPLPRDEVVAKYRDMALVALPDPSVARVEELVWSLDSVEDALELGRALRAD